MCNIKCISGNNLRSEDVLRKVKQQMVDFEILIMLSLLVNVII